MSSSFTVNSVRDATNPVLTDPTGYCDGTAGVRAFGTLTPSPAFVQSGAQIEMCCAQDLGGGAYNLILRVLGSFPATLFDSITFIDSLGVPQSFTAASATYAVISPGGTLVTNWTFSTGGSKPFLNATSTLVTLTDSFTYTTPPVLQANGASYNSVPLVWSHATDSSGNTPPKYLVFRGGAQIGITDQLGYTDTTVVPGTANAYTVAAADGAGVQQSALSNTVNVTTPPLPTFTVYGAFVPVKTFKPVLLANGKGIMPRVYMPLGDTTIRSK